MRAYDVMNHVAVPELRNSHGTKQRVPNQDPWEPQRCPEPIRTVQAVYNLLRDEGGNVNQEGSSHRSQVEPKSTTGQQCGRMSPTRSPCLQRMRDKAKQRPVFKWLCDCHQVPARQVASTTNVVGRRCLVSCKWRP